MKRDGLFSESKDHSLLVIRSHVLSRLAPLSSLIPNTTVFPPKPILVNGLLSQE